MKTIKTLLFVLLSTLFLSCSETEDAIFEEIVEEEIVGEDILKSKTYHFRQYYEDAVVINQSTSDDDIDGYRYYYYSNKITLGRVIFQGRYTNNEVIDTLTIDLTSFNRDIKELVLNHSWSPPNQIEGKYATINYLNIIGLDENPDLKIRGNAVYDKVQVINSNVSIDKLNSISEQNGGNRDMFEKIDYERKEWEWAYIIGSNNYAYKNFQDQPIGYIDYEYGKRKGIKIEIMNITENYN